MSITGVLVIRSPKMHFNYFPRINVEDSKNCQAFSACSPEAALNPDLIPSNIIRSNTNAYLLVFGNTVVKDTFCKPWR